MQPVRHDVTLYPEPWFQDHAFAGNTILPAVESMALLAISAQKHCPTTKISTMDQAEFPRFLIVPDKRPIPCVIELAEKEQQLQATLYSRKTAGKFSRLVKHAALSFGNNNLLPPVEQIANSSPDTLTLSAKTIYSELVPFGAAYQNLISADICHQSCVARLRTPPLPITCPALGSPFLLDSAMHGACVWGQRFAGFVPFPVGFKHRRIITPSLADSLYEANIIPVLSQAEELVIDMDIVDMAGNMVEQIRGLQMRDVSKGTILPPDWIRLQEKK